MNNSKFYKIGIGVSVILIVIASIFIIIAKNRDKKIANVEEEPPAVMSSTNLVEDDSLTVDTKSEDFKEIENVSNKNVTENKKATEKKTSASQNKDTKNAEKTSDAKEQKQENTTTKEVVKDPSFKYPVKGEIIQDYAKDKLVYSATLGEWITHTGIDIKADKTTVVTSSADGCVKSIKNDPRYGLTVVIEHSNGFYTVYSNLLTAEFVSVGEKVTSGQTIGTVGNTAAFEILDEAHLHFEILKESEPVDPNMYLKN